MHCIVNYKAVGRIDVEGTYRTLESLWLMSEGHSERDWLCQECW